MNRKPALPDNATASPNAVEKQRRPDGAVTPGESHGKRTNEERNDPEVEPGAAEGQLRDYPAQI